MQRKNSQTVGEVIREYLKVSNLENKIFEQKIIRLWGEVLGEEMASYTSQLYVRNKILYVHMTSSILRNELMMCRERLVKKLNESVGTEVISDIVIR
ncbi:MAG: DUF721 domain-containing protein [Bacteroidales bacterium]|nr:DUF721 domain-containing protein [Bacteroidales bacterium]